MKDKQECEGIKTNKHKETEQLKKIKKPLSTVRSNTHGKSAEADSFIVFSGH